MELSPKFKALFSWNGTRVKRIYVADFSGHWFGEILCPYLAYAWLTFEMIIFQNCLLNQLALCFFRGNKLPDVTQQSNFGSLRPCALDYFIISGIKTV